MKLGDMTIKQIAEICANRKCAQCPFFRNPLYKDGFGLCCQLLQHVPSFQDLDMEVEINAEN